MNEAFVRTVLSWLLTYAMHSTVLLAGAYVVTRWFTTSALARDFAWKLALVGGLLTATVQVQGGVRPAGSLAFARAGEAVITPAPPLAKPAPDIAGAASPTSGTRERDGIGAVDASATHAQRDVGALDPRVEVWLLMTWVVLALAFALRYLARRLILAGRLIVRRPITGGPLREMLDVLRRAFGHKATVQLTAATTISSPVALGLNEICVPEVVLTDLDEDQQRGLLAHELAHLARRDPLWLDAASLIERIFFFQPLNRLARVELQRNAEYICDDWAAAHNGSGMPLAKCLARVAEWIEAAPLGVPVAGMAEQRSQLVTRISRLLEGRIVTHQLSRGLKLAVSLAALAVVVAAVPGMHRELPAAQQAEQAPQARQAQQAMVTNRALPADSVVVQALIERLKDADAGVRAAAAQSLGNLKARRAVPALVALVGDANREVRSAVAEALGELEDERAVPALTKLLGDGSPEVRAQAIDAMGQFENSLPVAALVTAAGDERAEIRARAAELLGRTDDRAATPVLVRLLKDSRREVRHSAIEALTQLKDASVAAAVRGALTDADTEVRVVAIEYLREMRQAASEAEILKFLSDPAADVRTAAIEWAHEQPAASFVPALKRLMLEDEDSDVREAAVDALSEIRGPAASEALRAGLNAKDAKVRRAAASALGDRS